MFILKFEIACVGSHVVDYYNITQFCGRWMDGKGTMLLLLFYDKYNNICWIIIRRITASTDHYGRVICQNRHKKLYTFISYNYYHHCYIPPPTYYNTTRYYYIVPITATTVYTSHPRRRSRREISYFKNVIIYV